MLVPCYTIEMNHGVSSTVYIGGGTIQFGHLIRVGVIHGELVGMVGVTTIHMGR